jgi:hypothetical protein
MKTCCRCRQSLHLDSFYSDKRRKDNKHPECKPCQKKRSAQYRQKNKTVLNANAMVRHYVRTYGITQEEFLKKAQCQDNKCAICSIDLSFDKINSLDKAVMDHDHSSGKLRSVLCSGCNTALGLLKDNTDILNKAINYLKEHQN